MRDELVELSVSQNLSEARKKVKKSIDYTGQKRKVHNRTAV